MKRFWQWVATHPYLFLFIILLPVMLLRDFTPRNELKYMAIADNALADGTFWTFSFNGEPYADKPPFYLWLVMLVKAIFDESLIPIQRLIICLHSFLPAMGVLEIMRRWVKKYAPGSLNETWSFWMLATCGLWLGVTVVARMDMLMTFFIVWALYEFWAQQHRWTFAFLVFMGLFTKGPFGILVPLLATLVWSLCTKNWHMWLRFWSWRTWLVISVCCAIWFGMTWKEGGNEYLNNMLFHQTFGRAVNSWQHNRHWYHYLKTIWYTTLPWGPFCIFMILWRVCKRCEWKSLQGYFICIFLVTFFWASCVSGKLDIYLLPIYPFMVYGGMMSFKQFKEYRAKKLEQKV